MTSMKKGLFKKLQIPILLIALIFTFSFITGFTKPDIGVADNVIAPLLNVGEEEVEKWICTCGFIYDPEETGINFKDLADDQICPECSATKDAFAEEEAGEEEEEETSEEGPYLAHLRHVIAMRMKHLAVFQRVLEAKDPGQHSVYAINHAIIQSSKSILKMQEVIGASLNDGTGDSNNTDTTEEEVENKDKKIRKIKVKNLIMVKPKVRLNKLGDPGIY